MRVCSTLMYVCMFDTCCLKVTVSFQCLRSFQVDFLFLVLITQSLVCGRAVIIMKVCLASYNRDI